MYDMFESEPMTVAGRLQPRSTVDEKDHAVDQIFLRQFREKHRGNHVGSRRTELNMEQAFMSGLTAAYSQYRSELS